MQRIICVNPDHDEKTPSMVLYDNHAHCFGCGFTVSLSDLDGRNIVPGVRPPPVDLGAELARIKALPKARVRGLDLPVDGDSFYIPWPSGDYYKRRKFIPGDSSKYLCPRGHKKPLFVPLLQPVAKTLAVVEGEMNALSIASLSPPFSVCSPGGCGDFSESTISKKLPFFLQFATFLVIVDKDEAGVKAAIEFKKLLLRHTPKINIVLMPRDANDLLVAGELPKEVAKWLRDLNGNVPMDVTKPRR